MKRLVIPPPKPTELRYPVDVQRIISVCEARGYVIDALTAEWAWCEYSDRYAAGWLFLPEDDEQLFSAVRGELDVEVRDD